MKQTLRILILSILSLLLFSCASPMPEKRKRTNLEPKRFPTLKNYSLSLQVVSSKREFYPGENPSMTFRLKNKGKKVNIYEWMADEPSNIIIYYRPYKKGIKKFIKKDWQAISPEMGETIKRSSIELNPNNSILIDKKLPFIKEIKAYKIPQSGLKYYVIGELNLQSIRARSRPIIIYVK